MKCFHNNEVYSLRRKSLIMEEEEAGISITSDSQAGSLRAGVMWVPCKCVF